MKKIIILIPVFNDWESLEKLIVEINENVKELKKIYIECVVINDSSSIKQPKLFKPKLIKSIQILNMKENKGHARCNAFGIRYVIKNKDFDYLILMDGDGEDRPIELKKLINKILEEPNKSVVAKRIKRSEGLFFRFLYSMHKLITLVFTGKKINFGNYSCLIKEDVKKLSTQASLWSSYSGSVKKNLEHFNEIDSERGTRYFGPSKMSFLNLINHSLSIISVFKGTFLIRSALFIIVYILMIKSNASLITALPLIFLLVAVYLISNLALRENIKEFNNSLKNINNIEEIK